MAGFIWEAPFRPSVEEKHPEVWSLHEQAESSSTPANFCYYTVQFQFTLTNLFWRLSLANMHDTMSCHRFPFPKDFTDIWNGVLSQTSSLRSFAQCYTSVHARYEYTFQGDTVCWPRPALSTPHALEAAQLCVSTPSLSQHNLFLLSHSVMKILAF